MKTTLLVTFLTLFPLASLAAAPRCESLFGGSARVADKKLWSATPVYEAYTGGLNLQRLERDGYVVKGDRLFDKAKDLEIGVIKKFQPSYLFQWAEADFHRDLIRNRGVFDEWMAEILKTNPQAAGRGFYVSTDPFDSASYGSDLTTLKVKAPVYVLEASTENLRAYFSSSVQRTLGLAEAGIDALRFPKYETNWFNFISNRHLQAASAGLPEGAVRAAIGQSTKITPLSFFYERSWVAEKLQNLFSSPKSKENVLLGEAVGNVFKESNVEENLKLIFSTKSENAKLLSLMILYNKKFFTSNTVSKFPPEVLNFLSLKASENSSFEARFLILFWNKLSVAEQAAMPISKDFLDYTLAYIKVTRYKDASPENLRKVFLGTPVSELADVLSSMNYPAFEKSFGLVAKTVLERGVKSADATGFFNFFKALMSFVPVDSWKEVRQTVKITAESPKNEILNDAIFELYDFNTFLRIVEKNKKSGKEALAGIREDVAHYQRARASLKLENIKTMADFIKAGKSLYGIDLQVREKNLTVKLMDVPSHNLALLRENNFLKVESLDKKNDLMGVSVEYWSPGNKHTMPAALTEMVEKLLSYQFVGPTTQSLLLAKISSPEGLHRVFMSLHPFQEGNEKMGALLYEILNARLNGDTMSLDYPNRDWNLNELPPNISIALQGYFAVSMAWIRQATTDEDLVNRTQLVMDFGRSRFSYGEIH